MFELVIYAVTDNSEPKRGLPPSAGDGLSAPMMAGRTLPHVKKVIEMAELFVPLEQAAKIEGVGYNTLVQRMKRNPTAFKTREEPRSEGGKARVLVALSSLSSKARKAYKAAQKVDGGDAVIKARASTEAPWYVGTDLNWFIENHKTEYYQVVELTKQIGAFIGYDDAGRTAHAEEFSKRLSVSSRTLYRYAEQYLEASAWALKLERADGHSYEHIKVLALCRKPRQADGFPSLSPEHRAFLENLWFDKSFAQNRPTVQMLYEKFEEHAGKAAWEISSYQTVARYIAYLMEGKKLKNAHTLAARGLREWKRNVMVKGIRDTSHVPVMGILQGDSHTCDFFVEYTEPSNGKVTAIRPVLVAWIDTRTRTVMGPLMTKHPNQDVIKLSILKAIYGYGTPEALLFDNGKDYTAQSITGRKRNERSAHDALLTLDSEALGFIRSAGIKDDYRSLPYQPWSKGQIERFFNTVCLQFSRWFGSYVGTLTASKTSSKVEKDAKKLLSQGKLITLEECYEQFELFLEKYHNKVHRGLKAAGEKWTTPASLFANAEERYVQPAPALELAEMLLMRAEDAYVRPTGIQRFGSFYMNYALNEHIGSHVNVRWNPADLSKLYVYDLKGRKICEAEKQQLLHYNGYAAAEEIEAHVRTQNRHLAQDRDKLKQLTTPYETRVGLPVVAGVPDFIIESKKTKVIALPKDAQYQQEVRERTSRKKPEANPYLDEKAESALTKLRDMA